MAYTFNGTNQYLISSTGLTATTNFSVFLRFKPVNVGANQVAYVSGDTVQTNMNYLLTLVDTGLWAGTYNGAGDAAKITGLSMSNGTWYGVLGVWTNSAERIVYDGTTRVVETTSAALTSTNRVLFAAQMLANVVSSYANITLADMAIWGTAILGPTQIDRGEVDALFKGVSPKHVRPQALTDYWPQFQPNGDSKGIKGNVLTATNSNTLDSANPRLYC